MSVQCPPNVYPGTALNIQTPGGLMRISVPQGVSPGMTFQVAVPLQQPAIPIVRPQPVQMAPMMPVPMQVPNPNAISQQQRELDFYHQQQTMARQQPVPQPMQPVPQQPQQRSVVITIPNGVRPGNKMTVNLPDGRQVTVVVPQGMHPGNKMTVNYNAPPAPAPQQHQPVQQYQAPPPPMPPMQPVMQQPQQSENKQVMITIPNGVVAGNRMTVNLPNGQQAQVVVPQGYSAGMKMTISYKATRQQSQPPPQQQQRQSFTPMPQPVMQQQQQKVEKTLKITIPKGVKAGNTITVNLPDGRSLKVKVPKGMKAGNSLTVNYSTTVTTQVPQVQQPRYAAPSAPMYVPINNNVAPAPQPMNVPQNVDGGASWSDK